MGLGELTYLPKSPMDLPNYKFDWGKSKPKFLTSVGGGVRVNVGCGGADVILRFQTFIDSMRLQYPACMTCVSCGLAAERSFETDELLASVFCKSDYCAVTGEPLVRSVKSKDIIATSKVATDDMIELEGDFS